MLYRATQSQTFHLDNDREAHETNYRFSLTLGQRLEVKSRCIRRQTSSESSRNMATHEPILKHSRFCMIIAGIWPLALPTHKLLLRSAYSLYSGLLKLYFPMFLVSLCVEFGIKTIDGKNVDQIFSQLIYVIALVSVGIAALLYQRRDFREIIRYVMKDDMVVYLEEEEIRRCHLEQVRFCSKACMAITILTIGAGTSICLENFWRRFEVGQLNKRQNESVEKPFPYDLYYYSVDKDKHAGILLIVNDIAVIVNGLLVASTKIVFFSCVIYPASILKRLQIRFERWKGDGGCLLVVLRELVRQHQTVIWFITKLNGSIKYLIFMEFLLNSLNIAAVSIQFITFEKTMLASPILFFGILFTQTFVLGWSANEIKVQSLMLADALYRSPWYEQNETVKKMVLTMIMRAQTPLVLTIGPFDAMTTQSALAIMKGSYSYVSVMLNNYQ
ncbi:odorant receptor 46a-like isoform X1 [Cylas formicarius]|uniref:odorant receptor 46a-like isoform X1 n=1 Tax=Cylas formicarius TaxID=197179 RepID=UPI0029585C12|nr:odorant receptor 46a-like isoform X1 [Cylas formicarius]